MTTGTEIDVDAIISGSTKKEEPEQPKAGNDDIESSPAGIRTAESKDSNGPNIGSSVSDHLFHMKERILNPYGNEEEVVFEKEAAEEAAGDEDDMEQALSEDIYSLMSTVGVWSLSFWFAVWTFVAQAAITVLVFFDLVVLFGKPPSTNGTTNRMLIPVDAPMTVTVAQFFGVALIVNFAAAQGDLLVGFSHLLKGYDREIHTQNAHMTCFKWYMAGFLQFFVGAVLVIDLAVLLMQSTSNIILCLNFAALHFVQDIDDVSFTVASMGLISRQVQKDCEKIGDITVKSRETRRLNIYRRVFLTLLTIGLYVFYFTVAGWQWSGRFMCHSLHVQFGDDFGKVWPHYSSVFTTPSTNMLDRTEGRAVYIDPTNTMRLAYCGGERAWAFSYLEDDHCDYFIKSTETSSYDIMDIAHREWFAQTQDLGEVPMDFMSVTCNDCNDQLCSEEVGQCVNNRCVCNDNRLGINCEFVDDDEHLCEFMALDRRTKGDIASLSFAAVFMRKTYRRLIVTRDGHHIEHFFNRPFYISAYSLDRNKVETFIVFSGYRWIMYGLPQEAPRNLTITQFEDFLIETRAHEEPLDALSRISELNDFIPLFFSGPIQYETRSHDVDPLTASWVLASIDEDENPIIGAYADIDAPVSASFLCTKCNNETNPCLNNGVCGSPNVEATQCDCNAAGVKSYGGFMCEYAYGCDERPELAVNGCECDTIFKICTSCDTGYYGNLCQFYKDIQDWEVEPTGDIILDGHFKCENATCQNGGYCTNSVEACKCLDGWSGARCEDPVVEVFICTNTTCLNGGVCNNSSDACLCPHEYTGDTCDEFMGFADVTDTFPVNNTSEGTGDDFNTTTSDESDAEIVIINESDGIAPTASPTAKLLDQADCIAQTDCETCLEANCVWFPLLEGCALSCDKFPADSTCYSSENFPDQDAALVCRTASNEAADRELCFARMDCASCTSTLKSDGGRCQWYVDSATGVEWCHTGGCDQNGVCGEETCADDEEETAEDTGTEMPTETTENTTVEADRMPDTTGTDNSSGATTEDAEDSNAMDLLAQYAGGNF